MNPTQRREDGWEYCKGYKSHNNQGNNALITPCSKRYNDERNEIRNSKGNTNEDGAEYAEYSSFVK
ncbi:hypothetical protein ACFST9_17595 [Hymenobacter monticola]|uniref:Uncharacterized protein n=1 Tax=Hymenobacter monticola TaxID=1705399 RepID=A0ABY4AZZ5_9BACT|nr:hypothetical protein [Hymenobacter monticola]UOE32280.1 hypothetical protein MTP16_14185 [Hymenobacter monticola]